MSKPDKPNGYEVFGLTWRGCWHWKRSAEAGMSKCYDSEASAIMGAREDFGRRAAMLKAEAV